MTLEENSIVTLAKRIFKEQASFFIYAYDHWQRETHHENHNHYENAVQLALSTYSITVPAIMTHTPFGAIFDIHGNSYHITVNQVAYSLMQCGQVLAYIEYCNLPKITKS